MKGNKLRFTALAAEILFTVCICGVLIFSMVEDMQARMHSDADMLYQNLLPIILLTLLLIFMEIRMFMSSRSRFILLNEYVRTVSRAAGAAFKGLYYIDLQTMLYTASEPDRQAGKLSYEEAFADCLEDIHGKVAKAEFEKIFSPQSLRIGNGCGKKIIRVPIRVAGLHEHRIFEFSLLPSGKRKQSVVILVKDVTEDEKSRLAVIESVATHYTWVYMGNIKTGFYRIIKGDAEHFPQESVDWLPEQDAEKLKKSHRRKFCENLSLPTIQQRLQEADMYDFAVETKEEHWYRVKVVRGVGYPDSGEFFIGIENIDERMQYQQKLKRALAEANLAAQAKTDFLSRMSHDIRTPLNGIIGMTYIAQQEKNSPRIANCLDKIAISSNFLLGLVNDILDLSKMENEKMELHPEPYGISRLKDYLDAVIRPLASGRKQQLFLDLQGAEPYRPLVDVLRLNQVMFNLLSNAIKYTPENGSIRFRLLEQLAGGKRMHVMLQVSDTGRGMTEAFQKVLFNPFVQENREDNAENRGTGLGLVIVKKIVDLFGGNIRVESKLGQGTTFRIDFQTNYAEHEAEAEKPRKAERSAEYVLTGLRILLCEDNPLNQELMKTILESRGILVEIAENGERGVEMFTASSQDYYQLILMDLRMPILNGYEATKQIRSLQRSDAAIVPIVAMTADAYQETIEKCFAAGMDEHIAKPVDPEHLFSVLAVMMQVRK